MGPHLSFRQYRRVDLLLFALILGATEYVIATAAGRWFTDQLYTVSVTSAVTAIVMMRWGPWAAIHACAGGLVWVLASGGNPRQLLIYGVGNELSLAALLLFQAFGRERIRENVLLTLLYALCVQLLMQLGRGIVSLATGADPDAIVKFFTMDALSDLFTMVIVWIARRLDGVFEDQKTYLLRVQNARGEESGGTE